MSFPSLILDPRSPPIRYNAGVVHAFLDQPYACPDGIPLCFDLFRPDTEDPVPLVLCVHGGGWITGDKTDMRPEASWLVEHGYAAACPAYRLAPLHPYPAAVIDVHACVGHLNTQAEKYGLLPDRVAAWGISAGGHLASMLGAHVPGRPDGRPAVQAVVDVCGLADLTRPREQHHEVSFGFLDQFLGVTYEGNEALFAEASPVHAVRADAPPFLIFHGDADDIVTVEQSDALASRLQALGVPVRYHRLPGERHALSDEAWTLARGHILAFLDETLHP